MYLVAIHFTMRLLILFLLFSVTLSAQQQPNIIYIMSDDHDADAISAYNKKFISTPNIDRIAKEGVLFSRAFVANSICGPVRATLITGQHSHKNGMKDNRTRFDSSRITMPKLMQQGGYQTAIVGKWHLTSYPTGFDNRDRSKPFLLHIHHKAPHRYFFAPLKYIEQYHNKTFPEPPTLYLDTAGHGTAWHLQTMSILHDMKLCSDLKVDPAYLKDIPDLKPDSLDIVYYNSIFNRIPEADHYSSIPATRECISVKMAGLINGGCMMFLCRPRY